MLFLWGRHAKNRSAIIAIRDEAPTAVEACARLFTDARIADDGTVSGRVYAILLATEHKLIPGLQMGVTLGLTGFRPEFDDPWESSKDQVGHFLTAVRFAFDARFLANPLFPLLLGGWYHPDMALRLMIGHEKAPDPPDVDHFSLQTISTAIACFRTQYHAVTPADIQHFKAGQLTAISVGTGLGNSRADLALSYCGWQLGHTIATGQFARPTEIADWVRRELGPP